MDILQITIIILSIYGRSAESVSTNEHADDIVNNLENYLKQFNVFTLNSKEKDGNVLLNYANKYEEMSKNGDFANFLNVSDSCIYTLNQFFQPAVHYILTKNITALAKLISESHILSYLDAWPKLPTRLLLGNTGWYGSYDECQLIPNGAHYCLADMTLQFKGTNVPGYYGTCVPSNNDTIYFLFQNVPGYYGTCVPSNCSNKDVFKLLHLSSPFLDEIIDFPEDGSLASIGGPVLCNDKQSMPADTITFIVLFSILLILCFFGTITEGIQDCLTPEQLIPQNVFVNTSDSDTEKEFDTSKEISNESVHYQRFGSTNNSVERTRGNTLTNFLMCFSVLKNSRAILSTAAAPGVIGCINGIRAISMTWVILGHVFFFGFYVKVDNLITATTISQRFSFQAIANAYVSVDTFFLLSGLLVSYIALKKMDGSNGSFPLIGFYVHRFVRLTPTYLFAIFVYTSVYPRIVDSPLGIILKNQGETSCHKYWWTNMLYINNFYPTLFSEECLGWSWYLANDMQFYIISPIFIYIMYRFKTRGALISTGTGVLLCVIISAIIIGVKDYPSLISEAFSTKELNNPAYMKRTFDFSDEVYIKPYTRIAPYLIGLLLGHVLSRKIYITSKPNLAISLFGWIIAFGLGLSVIYGPFTVFKPNGDMFNKTENVLYGAFARVAWSLALAWVIYACHNKMGGTINSFLSWSVWIPLSRLTFGAYLLHPIILSYYYRSLDNPLHYQDHSNIFIFLSTLVVSYSLAFGMALMVDLPVFNIEKMVMKYFAKSKKDN